MLEMIDFSIRNTNPEKIGYKGENLAETLEILTDSGSEWSYTLETRMGCNAYSVAVMDYSNGKITLPLTASILRMEGTHEAQIVAIKGEIVKKSNIFFIRVGDAISAGQNLPGVEESIFNQQVSTLTALVQSANDAKQEIADNAERAEQAAQRAEDEKTVAVDAAKRAEDSEVIASAEALSARASAIRAETFAQKAEEIVEGFSPEGGGSGGYNPPEGGIPLTDLSEEVQVALQKAETALQSFEESDPTVPAWAKSPNKPTYTAEEVGALPVGTEIHVPEKEWVLKGTITTAEKDTGVVVDLSGFKELVVSGYTTATGSVNLSGLIGSTSVNLISGVAASGSRSLFAMFSQNDFGYFGNGKFSSTKSATAYSNTLACYATSNGNKIEDISSVYFSSPATITECNLSIYAR